MRSYATIALAALVSAYEHAADEMEFLGYIAAWNKDYPTTEEYNMRLANWLKTEEFIREVNSHNSGWRPQYHHTAGHNKFSDWSTEEYEALLTERDDEAANNLGATTCPSGGSPSGSKDWRETGCVNPVQDQGSCGSCWSFAASAGMESSYCIDGGALLKLSEQQLVDCDTSHDSGCSGGLSFNAWNYYLNTHGQELEADYPYKAKDGSCSYNSGKGKVMTVPTGTYCQVNGNDGKSSSKNIMEAVMVKPNAVSIYASSVTFQTYHSGVITNASCANGTSTNHAVEIVGYNNTGSTPYYIVRNSWGSGWGDDGYVNIGMSDTYPGICAINKRVGYPFTQAWTN